MLSSLPGWSQVPADQLPELTREQIIATAQQYSDHVWICRAQNRAPTCPQDKPYVCDWGVNEQVTGLPYDWGGFDDPQRFENRLARGDAAGSHSKHGSTDCTAGIDCSGFVSRCWASREKYSTNSIWQIANRLRYNWFTEMKPGDALVREGHHIVLFAGYAEDHRPIVYEASGGHKKVLLNRTWTWTELKDYYPIQYKNLDE